MKILFRLSGMLCAALLSLPVAGTHDFGVNDVSAHLSLKGVRQVAVTTYGFTPDVERYGIDGRAIQNAVEQRLKAAGIEILSAQAASQSPTVALLQVELHAVVNDYGIYSYAADIQLQQRIPLAASSSSFFSETVWSRGTSGWAKAFELQRVSKEISGLVDLFLADYAAQNQ